MNQRSTVTIGAKKVEWSGVKLDWFNPKRANSCQIKDFRPITLVLSLYKIILKVLSNRLKDVLEETISEVRGAFVAGRQI